MKNLYTINELSKILKISTPTLYRWVHRKEIPYVKLGGKVRFLEDEIIDFIQSNSIKTSKSKKGEIL